MLDADELLQLQQDAYEAACDLPCVIQRQVRTPNASGGADTTWEQVAPGSGQTLFAGVAQPSASQLQNFGYLVAARAAFQVKLPVGTSVLEQDHLIVAGETLEVVKDLTPRSYPSLVTLLCAEVK